MALIVLGLVALVGLLAAMLPVDPITKRNGLILFFGCTLVIIVNIYRTKKQFNEEKADQARKKKRIDEIVNK